jgi:hypothetical protein
VGGVKGGLDVGSDGFPGNCVPFSFQKNQCQRIDVPPQRNASNV